MGPLQHADQEGQKNRAQPPIAEPPSPAWDVPAQQAAAALRHARLGLPTLSSTDVLTLQRTLGNSAVNRLLRTSAGQHSADRSPVQRKAGSDALSPGSPVQHSGQSGQRLVIQRMGIEQFYEWFHKARTLDTVEQRHAYLLRALGWQEFGSFQFWLQQTNTVHVLFGQERPQPQAPQNGSPYSPSHPTSPYSQSNPTSLLYSPSSPRPRPTPHPSSRSRQVLVLEWA